MATDSKTLESFLGDVGGYIRERALEAKTERDALPLDTPERQFQDGRVVAFNEVVSILQQTLDGFEIPRMAMNLDGLDPDRDLV
jgi:hypothetical protein